MFKRGVKMRRKTNKTGVLAIIGMVSALLSSACGSAQNTSYNPADNVTPTLYGPAYSASEDYNPSLNENTELYGPPSVSTEEYKPELNINQDIYGPPEDMMKDKDDNSSIWKDVSDNTRGHDIAPGTSADVSSDGEFNPKDNVAETLYGPPAGKNEATE